MLIKKDGYKNNWLLTQFWRLSLMLDVEGITLAVFISYEDGFTYAEILEFLRVHHGFVVRLYRAFFAISDLTKTCAIWQKKNRVDCNVLPTIMGKNFHRNLRNHNKLDRDRKPWYLLLCSLTVIANILFLEGKKSNCWHPVLKFSYN